jgi:TolB-like protein/Flp pilus assembly protein TadD
MTVDKHHAEGGRTDHGGSRAERRIGLLSELRRRKVFRVAAAYAIVGWLLVQAADILLGNFGAPSWVFQSFVTLLMLGFPVALFLAWAYELTPEGVRRSDGNPLSAPGEHPAGRRFDRVVMLGLVAVIAVLLVDRYLELQPPLEPVEAVGLHQSDGDPVVGSRDGGRTGIAVLPFANLSPEAEQEYFADGITEEILTRLAGLDGLRVISRTSVMRYKHSELSLPAIADELGVTHILEGSVRKSGDRIRITGQLIHAESDEHLWAESFDRDLSDIFAVQSEIAVQIAEALRLQLSEREQRRLVQGGTDNAQAYELYLRGLSRFQDGMLPGPAAVLANVSAAESLFRGALELDPDFAAAHAGLSRSLIAAIEMRPVDEHEARYEAAIESARRAIALAPELAAGYVRLGHAYRIRGQADAALAQLRLASELDPDDPETLEELARIHTNLGQFEHAITLQARAIAAAPGQFRSHATLGYYYFTIGDLERAEAEFRRAHEEILPNRNLLACYLSHLAIRRDEARQARDFLDSFLSLTGEVPFAAGCAATAASRLGDWDTAMEIFQRQYEFFARDLPLLGALILSRTDDAEGMDRLLTRFEQKLNEELPILWGSERSHTLAQLAALRGDVELAMRHLHEAVDRGWLLYRELELDPTWSAMRSHPEFIMLAERVERDLERIRARLRGSEEAGP